MTQRGEGGCAQAARLRSRNSDYLRKTGLRSSGLSQYPKRACWRGSAQVNAAFVGSLAETLSSALNVELFREAEFYYFLQTTGNIPLCKHSRLYNAGSSR